MIRKATSDGKPGNEPVLVYTSIDFNEIALIKSMLKSADIEFFVENESQTGWGPITAQCPSGGGMKVFVRTDDGAEAAEIIASLTEEQAE